MTDQNETRHRGQGDGLRECVSVTGNISEDTRAPSPSQQKAVIKAIGDAIDELITLLDTLDGDPDLEDGWDDEDSFDREQCCEDEGAQCDDEGASDPDMEPEDGV